MFCFKKIKPYLFKLTRPYGCETILTGYTIDVPFIKLDQYGKLDISEFYAWDGPSGPSIKTDNFMRGSLVHDSLYQLMRTGALPKSCRKNADIMLRKICIEDGMFTARAWWVYYFVRIVGDMAIKPFDEIREKCL